MTVLQILAVAAALWVAASVAFCMLAWPRIARRLRAQHRALHREQETRR